MEASSRQQQQQQQPPLAAIVSYCSNERPFVDELLSNACKFADLVILSVGTRLYTGEDEDEEHIRQVQARHPTVSVARYAVTDAGLATPAVLHNESRKAGIQRATELFTTYWALLLDGDEIPDGDRVAAWWRSNPTAASSTSTVYKMANFWYFLHPCLVAEPHEDSVMLVHSSLLSEGALSHPRERDGIPEYHQVELVRDVTDGGTPMFHHYSWVRADRRALFRKVANWGHSRDRPWTDLLRAALDELDAGNAPTHDFVHGYPLVRLPRARHALAI